MRPYLCGNKRDKSNEKGKSPKQLIISLVSAFLRSFMRGRERGITPPSPIQYSTPYNQTPSIHPNQSTYGTTYGISYGNIPYTAHKPSLLSFILQLISSMFSIPFIHNIPPNCLTLPPPSEDSSTLSPPPLSPYLQSYIRRPKQNTSTPSIHYPYAYSLNTIIVFSLIHIIPPSCQAITLQHTPFL